MQAVGGPPLLILGNVSPLHVRVDVNENDAWRVRDGAPAFGTLRGNRDIGTPLTFVRFEPYVVPKKIAHRRQHRTHRHTGAAGDLQFRARQPADLCRPANGRVHRRVQHPLRKTIATPNTLTLQSSPQKDEVYRKLSPVGDRVYNPAHPIIWDEVASNFIITNGMISERNGKSGSLVHYAFHGNTPAKTGNLLVNQVQPDAFAVGMVMECFV